MKAALVSVLVLSEDSARDSVDTIAALFRGMVREVDPSSPAHRIDFEPLQNQEARRVLRANVWKSESARDQQAIRSLRQAIAEKILETPPGYVIFHVDGDTRWSERASSQNAEELQHKMLTQVRVLVSEVLSKKTPEQQLEPLIRDAMGRIFVLTPFYSIESWLYQNTRRAVALCDEHHRGKDREKFEHWGANRALLDEELKPKTLTCLGAAHNLELARAQFPVGDVYGASPSFTAAIELLLACPSLTPALRG